MVAAKLGQICFLFCIFDHSDQVSSQEEDTSSNNSNSPRFTQLNSQTTGLNSEKLDICKEKQASCEWTEYDHIPSSEDLSAFLADLELDAINKTKEQSQPIINSKISTRPNASVNSSCTQHTQLFPLHRLGDFTSGTIACEQALLLGESREVAQEPEKERIQSSLPLAASLLARAFSRGSLRSLLEMESLLAS